ncbi:MAG: hypothetical protein EOP84_12045, partial [Verrucomicrobiaceae bacterium]
MAPGVRRRQGLGWPSGGAQHFFQILIPRHTCRTFQRSGQSPSGPSPVMHAMKNFLLLLTAVASALASCPTVWAQAADPLLKVDDMIRLEVYQEPDLTVNSRILKSGEVVLVFLGPVKIAGLTVAKANEKIRELYDQDYIIDPKVSLTVENYSQDFVSVLGSVTNPGNVPLPASGQLDLGSVLALAGNTNPEASDVLVTRAAGGSTSYSISAAQKGSTLLRAGDRVTVGKSPYAGKEVQLLGTVQKTGPMAFPLNGELTLVEAVAKAGGTTMRIDNVSSPDTVRVYLSATADVVAANKAYTLIAQSKDTVQFGLDVKFDKGYYDLGIPNEKFNTGIVNFTLLDDKSRPVNERKIFIDHHDRLSIAVISSKQTYRPKDSVAIDVMVTNANGKPVMGSFALAVTDDAQVKQPNHGDNILTNLLLSSELKGSIQEPGWYFAA